MKRATMAVLATLGVAACTPTPPPVTATAADLERVVPVPPDEALARFARAASSLGLVAAPDGTVSGPGRPGWTVCPRITVRMMGGETGQRREARLMSTTVTVTPSASAVDGGTRIALRPDHRGRMLHTLDYYEFPVRCAPSGELERALLDATAAG